MTTPAELQRRVRDMLTGSGETIATAVVMRAALGEWEAQKALLPHILPKAKHSGATVTAPIAVDLRDGASAKETLRNIAQAIGEQRIGLEEGTALMEAVGKALDRITSADMAELLNRIEALELAPKTAVAASARQPMSRANGSTPTWGNIVPHPSVKGGS